MHWNHSYGTGMWIGMVGGTLLGWILLVGLGYLVVRALLDARSSTSADPVALLDRRLARGEIGIDDYRQRRELLSQRSGTPPAEPEEAGDG